MGARAILLLSAITLLGLALRLWSARGGLWVDEAWSAVMVERARTPLGIFTTINHDNNHHLNSLWMWLVGFGAPPIALRALSIITGTAAILVAAAIGAQRSPRHAFVTAALFAVSPIMVDYGSEARGYMPMLLALMTMVWLVLRWLAATDDERGPCWKLAALATLGLFSQLTMVFGLCAITLWVAVSLRSRHPRAIATPLTIRLLLPTIVATAAVFGLVFGAAAESTTGMQVGDYVVFSPAAIGHALVVMIAGSIGGLAAPTWIEGVATVCIALALAAVVRKRDPVAIFYLAAIIGLPLGLAVLRVGNTGMPRYFLVSALAIILLLASLLADGLGKSRGTRIASGLILALVMVASIRDNLSQAALRRGDTGAAIAVMAALSPTGASVLVDHLRPIATLHVGAAGRGYPLRIRRECPAPAFLHVDLDDDAPAANTTARCKVHYRLLVVRRRAVLSGVDWALYGRADLPEKRGGAIR
ncbi:glycosyltransferase family 39 protein [Sphingomonas faeni]|uniref:glycosyltransferase family 39 protein n=1 Tax=Sphingomonas faeni TaxID=185950 RepID=UPI003358DC54